MVLSKSQYATLGRLLVRKMPSIADSLLSQYMNDECRENDFTKIEPLFNRFCELKQINPILYVGPLNKSFKVEIRREFIAVIVLMYDPKVFELKSESVKIRSGLVYQISNVTKLGKSQVSRMIKESVIMVKAYDDFQDKVSDMRSQLTNYVCN